MIIETENYFIFSCLEVCIALVLFYSILWNRRRETDVKEAPRLLPLRRKAVQTPFKKSFHYINYIEMRSPEESALKVLPCRWLIFSEVMWNMWSVAMVLGCKLDRFGVVYSPFEYGIIKLFALPRIKRPPKPPNWSRINSIVDKLHEAKNKKNESKKSALLNNKRKKVLSTLGSDSILTMQREVEVQKELKEYCWMAGASKMLNESQAKILRSMIENTCNLVAGVIDIIFDTGASKSLTPFRNDFVGRITPCNIKLKGIASGLNVAGIGKVKWRFKGKNGEIVEELVEAYWVPDLPFRLFSPQAFFAESQVEGEFKVNKMVYILL